MQFHALAAAVLTVTVASGATLHPESIDAWHTYLKNVRTEMDARVHAPAPFLWLNLSENRMRRLRSGGIVTKAMGDDGRIAVPHALIHDWTGAIYLPGVAPGQVLAVLDQYDRYHEFYSPAVVDSRLLSSDGNRRTFVMRWDKKTTLARYIIDTEYESSYCQPSPDRWWSVSRTTRVQEVDDGTLRPAGTGWGYVWSIYSVTCVTAVDGGSVVELRALVLSRGIPPAFAWLVNPFLSRLSRDTLTTTLRQTRDAVTR